MFVMSSPVHNRLLIYSGYLLLQLVNGIIMIRSIHFGEEMQNADAKLKMFFSMRFRFISIWNLLFHAAYTVISLCCEINRLKGKERKSGILTDAVRNRLFCGIIWPVTIIISALFWAIYLYDQELLLPKYTEVVVSKSSNHVVHTAVLIFALMELAYNPRKAVNHWENLKLFYLLLTVYAITIYFTLWQRGVYPYIIMNVVSHKEVFLLVTFLYIISPLVYMMQWVLTPVIKQYFEHRAKVL